MDQQQYIKSIEETVNQRMRDALKSGKYLFSDPDKAIRQVNRSRRHIEDFLIEVIEFRRGGRK